MAEAATKDRVYSTDLEIATTSATTLDEQPRVSRFNICMCCLSIVAPIIWIVVYLYSCYSGGNTLTSEAVTESVLENKDTRVIVVLITFLSCSIYMFFSICRVVQIRMAFEAQGEYSGIWRKLNRLSAVLAVLGFLGVFLSSAIIENMAHSVIVVMGIVSLFLYIWITTALTMKERKKGSYMWDVIVQGGLSLISTICMFTYIGYYIRDCTSKGLDGSDGCKVNGTGNVCEWIGFFGMSIVGSSFVLTFQHDNAFAAIEKWWLDSLQSMVSCRK